MKYKNELLDLLENSYAPYSNYHVASIVETLDGKIFKGVNVENASYGAAICAERNAINNAVAAGYRKGQFKALYVMVDHEKLAFPCFLCRQTIVEFFDLDAELILFSKDEMEAYKISDVIINPWGEDNLK